MHNKPRKYGRPTPSVKSCRARNRVAVFYFKPNHHPDYPGIWHTFNGKVYPENVTYKIKTKDGVIIGGPSELVVPNKQMTGFIVSNYPATSADQVTTVPFGEVELIQIFKVNGKVPSSMVPEVMIGDAGDLIALIPNNDINFTVNWETDIAPGEKKIMDQWLSWLTKID